VDKRQTLTLPINCCAIESTINRRKETLIDSAQLSEEHTSGLDEAGEMKKFFAAARRASAGNGRIRKNARFVAH
jgi:hypothetical protein